MKRYTRLPFFFLVFLTSSLFGSISYGQHSSPLDYLRMNPGNASRADSDANNYLIAIAMHEARVLQSKQRIEGLSDIDIFRLKSLEMVLAPIQDMGQQIQRDKEWGARYSKLTSDSTIAKKVPAAMGESLLLQRVYEDTYRYVQDEVRESAENGYALGIPMGNFILQDFLQVSESQKTAIDDIIEDAKDDFTKRFQELLSDADRCQDKYFALVLKELSSDKQTTARNLIGQPVRWMRSSSPVNLDSDQICSQGGSAVGAKASELIGQGEIVNLDTVRQHGIVALQSHVYLLLQSPFTWDELEFTKAQRADFGKPFKSEVRDIGWVHIIKRDQRLEALLEGKPESLYPGIVSSRLVADQLVSLSQLELQILTSKVVFTFGVSDPQVSAALKLSEKEIQGVKVIGKQFESAWKPMVEEKNRRVKEFKSELSRRLIDVLSPAQVDKLSIARSKASD